jgi:ribosome-associated protein
MTDKLLKLVLKTLSDKLGEDIVTIDMRKVNPFTDTFVIVTAKNVRHAATMADELIAAAEKAGYPVRDYEGRQGSSWILVDLNGAVVHLFTEQARKEYQLETLWGDQPMKKYKD